MFSLEFLIFRARRPLAPPRSAHRRDSATLVRALAANPSELPRDLDTVTHGDTAALIVFSDSLNGSQILYVKYIPNDPNKAFYQQINQAAKSGNPAWMDTFALPVSDTTGPSSDIVIRQHYSGFAGPPDARWLALP